jgi:hypothetical protein
MIRTAARTEILTRNGLPRGALRRGGQKIGEAPTKKFRQKIRAKISGSWKEEEKWRQAEK